MITLNKLYELFSRSLYYKKLYRKIEKGDFRGIHESLIKYFNKREKISENILTFDRKIKNINYNGKVSIVIPVYNSYDFLKQCFESALNQTYKNLEIIIIDDCSNDLRVKTLLENFESFSKIKVIYNKCNEGISSAMNKGIIAAEGEWIAFLDCDDWLEDKAVEKLMKAMSMKKDSVYGYTDRINRYVYSNKSEVIDFSCRPEKDYFSELLIGMYTSHLKIIHKETFLHIGLHETRFDGTQDYDIALKIAFYFGDQAFCYLNEAVYNHRIHDNQTTNACFEKIEKRVDTIKQEAKLRNSIRKGVFNELVSFVILSYEKKEMTLKCIESINKTVKVNHEIIVFDNGSSMETVDYLKDNVENLENVKIYYSKENLGCPGGRREAIRLAKGQYVLTLDNDIVVTEGWIEELLVRINQQDVAAVCCKTVFPDGKVQFTGGDYAIMENNFIRFSLVNNGVDECDLKTADWKQCLWVPGGATLFKKNIINELEYSKDYINAYEDNDVALQIAKLGYKMLNCPSAKVYHYHIMYDVEQQRSEKKYLQSRYNNNSLIKSYFTFFRRNGMLIYDEFIFNILDIKKGNAGFDKQKLLELFKQYEKK